MGSDEQEIRRLFATWTAATKAGDIDTVLSLMADDVVFLRPGHPPMVGKSSFAAAAGSQPNQEPPEFDGTSEVQEVQVCGDWAFMWARLSLSITPPGGIHPRRLAGHTLSILKKQDGRWVLARDANLLAPVPDERAS